MQNIKSYTKETIPVFFAVDDCYAPYLAVAMRSLIDNASRDYNYAAYILIDKLSTVHRTKLQSMQNSFFSIEFVNVSAKLDAISSKLHLRDYYTKATYYRFFIPLLFPQYKRGIYLDCDIVVLGDISELYRIKLGDNYVGAVPEEVMEKVPVFGEYVERVLEIPCEQYFSAGILVMNLEGLRRADVESAFVRVLEWRQYKVTQDQDYLNVLCRNKVTYLGTEWNKTAFPDVICEQEPKIIHYKINWKPWHYNGVSFEDYFWSYAAKTPYLEELQMIKSGYSQSEMNEDSAQYERLMALAHSEIETDYDSALSPFDFMLKKLR